MHEHGKPIMCWCEGPGQPTEAFIHDCAGAQRPWHGRKHLHTQARAREHGQQNASWCKCATHTGMWLCSWPASATRLQTP